MNYWLLKTEPNTYGITHLSTAPKKMGSWEGVRNYQARNFLRDQMRAGDLAFFYHSNCKIPGITGIVKITKAGYPDLTALDPTSKYYDINSTPTNPRWYLVDIKLKRALKRLISISELRAQQNLADMVILRKGNRLSITPVTAQEWQTILAME